MLINSSTGEVENLWMRWDELKLPNSPNAIPVEKAWDKFWETGKLELRYLKQRNEQGSLGEVRLVYVLTTDATEGINALTEAREPVNGKKAVSKPVIQMTKR